VDGVKSFKSILGEEGKGRRGGGDTAIVVLAQGGGKARYKGCGDREKGGK